MPVIIKTTPRPPPRVRKGGRGGHFDQAVISLAPVIEELRAAGCLDIRGLMQRLNELGCVTSIGRPFTYGTLRRMLNRMEPLRVGEGPRKKLHAARNRDPRSR